MASDLSFRKLNDNWNADPNAPAPTVEMRGNDLLLRFYLNAFQYQAFEEGDIGILRFTNCVRHRLGSTNDEGWYRGQCRYSNSAPAWGEFYEVTGNDPRLDEPDDWQVVSNTLLPSRHFLFYFRDDTFECLATDWTADPDPTNALLKLSSATKMESRSVQVLLQDGTIRQCAIQVSEEEPWQIAFSGLNLEQSEFEDVDLFRCLVRLRLELEKLGMRLLCAGARRDVWPSGMSISMGGGRIAYVTLIQEQSNTSDRVDILDYAGADLVGTVSQQEEFHREWLNRVKSRRSG